MARHPFWDAMKRHEGWDARSQPCEDGRLSPFLEGLKGTQTNMLHQPRAELDPFTLMEVSVPFIL